MSKVSVNKSIPSPYIESESKYYRFKRRFTYAFAFKLLDRFLPRRDNLTVLEIGTGSGFFLYFANEHFQSSKFFGIEYDERLLHVTHARAPFADVKQGNAENFNIEKNKFDVIVSFQVIEHLYDSGAMLDNVRKHLKPDGIFLVTSPNLAGYGARLMREKWHGYREDHVSLKGKEEWDSLITSHGFKRLYSGSTFFSGIPVLNSLPLGVFNWLLLFMFGSLQWSGGESYVAVFKYE